jgi:starvation-inducible DNA-binding protein
MARAAAMTIIPCPPKGREETPVQLSRLLHAHEIVLKEARTMARLAAQKDDHVTADRLVGDVIRHNETQMWFLSAHLIGTDGHAQVFDAHH